jgi:hypothetical protein
MLAIAAQRVLTATAYLKFYRQQQQHQPMATKTTWVNFYTLIIDPRGDGEERYPYRSRRSPVQLTHADYDDLLHAILGYARAELGLPLANIKSIQFNHTHQPIVRETYDQILVRDDVLDAVVANDAA